MSKVVQSTLIGLRARILKSSDPSMVSLSGKVVLETRNTLVLSTEKGRRIVPKRIAEFEFSNRYGECSKVAGSSLVGRPEERIAKAV